MATGNRSDLKTRWRVEAEEDAQRFHEAISTVMSWAILWDVMGNLLMIQIDLVSYKEDGASSIFQRFYGGFSL